MDVADRRLAVMEEDTTKAEDESEGHSSPERPVHDLYVTDYPRSLCVRVWRGGGHPSVKRGGPVGTSSLKKRKIITRSPSLLGVHLSRLPHPRSVHEAITTPDAMDKKMWSLKSHDGYERVPRVPDMRTLHLGWVLRKTRPVSSRVGTNNVLVLTMASRFSGHAARVTSNLSNLLRL